MGRRIGKFAGTIITALIIVSFFGGCSSKKWPQPATLLDSLKKSILSLQADEQNESVYIHVVKWNGETLSIIAKWYVGSFTKWQDLADVNPDINPNKIFIGNQIRIPEALLITSQPMPASYVAQYSLAPADKETTANTTTPSPEEEEPLLFGPKGLSNTGKKQ